MEVLAERLTNYIINHVIIKREDYAVYKYGLQTGMEMCLCLGTCAIVAIYLNLFMYFLIFSLAFCPLRAYVGGIHMKHFFSCYLASVSVTIIGIVAAQYRNQLNVVGAILTVFAMYFIHKLSFLTTNEDEEAKDYFALQRKRILICIGFVFSFFVWTGMNEMAFVLSYVLFVTLISVALEVIRRLWIIRKVVKASMLQDGNTFHFKR